MSQLYRVWARFEPDHVNPLTGRKGQWRVTCVQESLWPFEKFVNVVGPPWFSKSLIVTSSKRYPRGSIIRPHKELNRVLAIRGAA